MNRITKVAGFTLSLLIGGRNAMAVEEAPYRILEKEGAIELREYAPQILAEVIVDGSLEDAGNKAFNLLFRYISGDNRTRAKIAMTAPVSQKSAPPERIAMTTPVGQQSAPSGWAVSFMMPSSFTMETLPEPTDPQVALRAIPARHVAAIRYSGTWSESRYRRNRVHLEAWLGKRSLTATGDPVWARYNPPFTPWFLRRNEVLIPIATPKTVPAHAL